MMPAADFRTIPLSKGQVAIVDPEDYDALSGFKWYARWDEHSQTFYAIRHDQTSEKPNRMAQMHRQILGVPPGTVVDHRDGNGLNNRRLNIRPATESQNQHNRGPVKNTLTGLKGVSFSKPTGKWMARIRMNYKRLWLGLFDTPEEASAAYIEAAKRLHGEFAKW